MKSSLIEENKNFYWDEQGFLCHFSGKDVGEPYYRFRERSDKERQEYNCHEKSIQVTPHGVLVEYDSNRFDIENEVNGFNRDDDDVRVTDSGITGFRSHYSKPEKLRHYINKMFYNNNNELVFEQPDYIQCETLNGDELVHLCDSTVTLTDEGIAVTRRNIANDFSHIELKCSFDDDWQRIDYKIDNSVNAKAEEFFTYRELNENYKKRTAAWAAYRKQQQEDADWAERNDERLHKFGFNNITLKTKHGQIAHKAYREWRNTFATQSPEIPL
jgi:ribosomal protein S3AE